ncbi:hypothetical protein RFM99_07775 [Mesorhizobium sp. VK4C]|uniref:hypothetical protein n=1 Tax=Mesorhizobium captivum TaxID=3072319 RepID=UPI002A23B75B|nr:hypothetical protein [Mesorhizobium sp. VK4C]MDX8498316.1 hypothetical protein [Mesorhizobium sp. VK4C]
MFLLQPAFDKAPVFDKAMRENKKASSVRDARIDIPHRTDEPLGQVQDPGIRPRGFEKSSRQARSRKSGRSIAALPSPSLGSSEPVTPSISRQRDIAVNKKL